MKSIYTNLKDYIMENEFCIHIFEDRINIVNYTGIYGFELKFLMLLLELTEQKNLMISILT